MNARDLDNYITGHYGEDQFPRVRIRSIRDLIRWVDDRIGPVNDPPVTPEEIDRVAMIIRSRDEAPNYGQDWSEYLASLPEDLLGLL